MDDRTRWKCEYVDVDGQKHFILFALKPVVWSGWWCTASSLCSTNKSFSLSSSYPECTAVTLTAYFCIVHFAS